MRKQMRRPGHRPAVLRCVSHRRSLAASCARARSLRGTCWGSWPLQRGSMLGPRVAAAHQSALASAKLCKYERRTQAPVHQSRPGSYQRIRCSGRKRVAHSHDRSCLPKHAPCLLQEGRLHWECSQMKHKQAAESLRGSARALLVPRAVARAAFEAGCDARLRTAPLPAHSASPRANACSESGRLRQMKLTDKQHAKPSRLPSAALHPWHSSSGFRHPTDSSGACAAIFAAASRTLANLLACSVRPLASDAARWQAACEAVSPSIGSAAPLALFERLQAPHR